MILDQNKHEISGFNNFKSKTHQERNICKIHMPMNNKGEINLQEQTNEKRMKEIENLLKGNEQNNRKQSAVDDGPNGLDDD